MGSILHSDTFLKTAHQLAEVVRFLAARGWTPATSSNFSARLGDDRFAISKSGRDKYAFSMEDVMVVDGAGRTVAPDGARPSAETLLHTLLYQDPAIGAVLHTHSLASTVLTMADGGDELVLEGFELIKGLAGNTTHETREVVPVFDNDQDMTRLASVVAPYWRDHRHIHGFLIRGHGLYTWGTDLAEARRHVETFEFLFATLMELRRH